MASDLRARLAAVPTASVEHSSATLAQVEAAVAYLASPEAIESLKVDLYWPKWASPWWQMLALYELGLADRIPKRTVRAMVAALDAMPLHTFPIREDEWPPGLDQRRHSSCHCDSHAADPMAHAPTIGTERSVAARPPRRRASARPRRDAALPPSNPAYPGTARKLGAESGQTP